MVSSSVDDSFDEWDGFSESEDLTGEGHVGAQLLQALLHVVVLGTPRCDVRNDEFHKVLNKSASLYN